jgi:tetratricopeptide (TPR) repeat protein
LPYVAGTLNNLAILQKAQNDFETARGSYEEALQIRRTLAAENPRTYLPYVAGTLNNLAVICNQDQNDFETARGSYEEALQIRRTLAAENPRTYLPDVAMTLINLSIFYLQAIPDQEKSIAMAQEALEMLQDFADVPYLERYAATALQVLQAQRCRGCPRLGTGSFLCGATNLCLAPKTRSLCKKYLPTQITDAAIIGSVLKDFTCDF